VLFQYDAMHLGGRKNLYCPPVICHWARFVVVITVLGCERSAAPPVTSGPKSQPTLVELRVLKPRPAPDAPLTLEQIALKEKLEAQLAADRPTHQLTLRDHRVVEGQVVAETPATVLLREGFGYSGSIISAYRRVDVAAIDVLLSNTCKVSRQDVALFEQFPQFHFAKISPYSVVTDAPYADVERTMRLLTQLRKQFEQHFAALIRPGNTPQNIQIVFFSTEEPFRAYARKVAPGLVGSAGFYSASENRLVLLNQLGTQQYAKVQDGLAQRRRALESRPDINPDDRHQASTRLATFKSEMTYEAKAMTERLVRHEGAHQLFAAYGIQSRYGVEPTWLGEGLAQYCEPGEIGAYHLALAERLTKARDDHRLLPLKTLLDHRDAAGFFSLGDQNIETAYAESWALTYFLLQGPHHAKFFDYIKSLRDIGTDAAAIAAYKAEPATLLLSSLGADFNTLETLWLKFVTRL
jgi:Protein of unknown function (DUF1570)